MDVCDTIRTVEHLVHYPCKQIRLPNIVELTLAEKYSTTVFTDLSADVGESHQGNQNRRNWAHQPIFSGECSTTCERTAEGGIHAEPPPPAHLKDRETEGKRRVLKERFLGTIHEQRIPEQAEKHHQVLWFVVAITQQAFTLPT